MLCLAFTEVGERHRAVRIRDDRVESAYEGKDQCLASSDDQVSVVVYVTLIDSSFG